MSTEKLTSALAQVADEAENAISRYAPFNSGHEGYAVLLEEVDELWDEVKKSPLKRDYRAMHIEAMQVAAVALRFMVDVTIPALEAERVTKELRGMTAEGDVIVLRSEPL